MHTHFIFIFIFLRFYWEVLIVFYQKIKYLTLAIVILVIKILTSIEPFSIMKV